MLFTSRNTVAKRIAVGFAMLLVLGLATEALAARKARATGFYRLGRGQVNLPMQFVISAMGNTGMHSIPLAFPNDDAMVSADATLFGMGASMVVVHLPENAVNGSYSALLPLMGTNNVQITTNFTAIQAPEASGGATFSAAGGPGAFTFCPVGGGMGVSAGTCPAGLMSPPQGSGTRNGRIIYLGGSGFGGLSQVFLNGGGLVTRPGLSPHGFSATPMTGFFAAHEMFGGGGGGPQVIGGPANNYEVNMLNGALYTRPLTAPSINGTISSMQAGPYITAGNNVTNCAAAGTTSMVAPNLQTTACVVGTGALKTGGVGTTTNTGFPFTTGTVLAQQSGNSAAGKDYFTITGSKNTNGLGIGNITLVAGGLALRTNNSNPSGAPGGSVDTISLTISEKTPSMSAGGFAAAAVLMVLAAGYAMRRRY